MGRGNNRSPLKYYGGKYFLRDMILMRVPLHKIYVEVFGGSAGFLFYKPKSKIEVYNDIDELLVNFFRVIRDEEKFKRFYEKLEFTLYSRSEHSRAINSINSTDDEVERALYYFIGSRQSFNGIFGRSWSYSRKVNPAVAWSRAKELTRSANERLKEVIIECDDFRNIIKRYDTEETFFYLDPPYVPTTRVKNMYRYEMSIEDHQDLINLILEVKGKVLLSGYNNEIYKKLEESGWNKDEIVISCFAEAKGKNSKSSSREKRVECLWYNYPIPNNLI